MVSSNFQEVIVFNETQRVNEKRAKLLIWLIIGSLIVSYSIWNGWRMVEAIKSPVIIGSRIADRAEIPVPGVVICGLPLDKPIECFESEGKVCHDYVAVENATQFVNMRGFDNVTGYYCYIFDPQRETKVGKKPLKFSNSTQKIALALYSSLKTNNTLGAITIDKWAYYGVFTEKEDPLNVNFQIVHLPSISSLYFNRMEKKQVVRSAPIIGGSMGDTAYDSTSDVGLTTLFTTSRISGFDVGPDLWCIFRIIPQAHNFDKSTFTQSYLVDVSYKRIEFPFLQLAANMGGFVSLLSALYFFLLGSKRLDPWGAVQRYVLKSVPPLPTEFPDPDTLNKNQQISYQYSKTCQSPDTQSHSINMFTENDYNDPQVQLLRKELRAEMQTIANDIGVLKLYLSKYYLQGVKM
ncbi:2233_t:CDS:2 [Ambispora gerdemannii]|uniref:2233_t:CDS:1 n=1 Tax=Ambispora gerdemannii TaxID=144530 RepID=A0A9N9CNJ5_9GLOM|nr:2233_t:CDS:2 [Ambispora gerdemannii]